MDSVTKRFWEEKSLDQLDRAEWESLCDGCGKCCMHKLEDEYNGEVMLTNVACKLLDLSAAQCSNYRHRKAFVPDCIRLTPRNLEKMIWLPESCAYRLVAERKPLPDWHHLLTGDRESIHKAGASVVGRAVSENDAGPLEHHLIESWDAA